MDRSRGDEEQAKKVQSVGLGRWLGAHLMGAGVGGAWGSIWTMHISVCQLYR